MLLEGLGGQVRSLGLRLFPWSMEDHFQGLHPTKKGVPGSSVLFHEDKSCAPDHEHGQSSLGLFNKPLTQQGRKTGPEFPPYLASGGGTSGGLRSGSAGPPTADPFLGLQ